MNGGALGARDRAPDGGDDEDEGPSWAERLLMVTSVAFTVLLFAYLVWQGVTTPAAALPTATVDATEPLPSGDVRVTVTFRNVQNVGLVVATVEVECETPLPELTFENVPADDSRTGYVTCPPGTTDPTAVVSSWIEA